MKEIFLESHNLQNPYTGFGQFNAHLIQALIQENEDFRLVLNLPFKYFLNNPFKGKNVKPHLYYDLQRYPHFRPRKKYNLWHSMNQNIKIEPYYDLPYVLTIHDATFFLNPKNIDEKRVKRFQEKLDRASAIVYISEYVEETTHQFLNIPNVISKVIPNGTNFRDKNDFELKMPQYIPERPFIFTIGEVKKIKNFKSLLSLIHPNLDLVIAGKNTSDYAQSIMEDARKMGIENQVHLLGYISENDKHYYYENCEAFCFPSLFEGFGLPVLEAMQYDKPIFLANFTSLPEIGGEAAFYWDDFEPENMKKRYEESLQKFQNEKKDYLNEYQTQLQKYSWTQAAKDYLEVYKQVIAMS